MREDSCLSVSTPATGYLGETNKADLIICDHLVVNSFTAIIESQQACTSLYRRASHGIHGGTWMTP